MKTLNITQLANLIGNSPGTLMMWGRSTKTEMKNRTEALRIGGLCIVNGFSYNEIMFFIKCGLTENGELMRDEIKRLHGRIEELEAGMHKVIDETRDKKDQQCN